MSNAPRRYRRSIRWLLGGLGLGAFGYATYVGATWWQYGRLRRRPRSDEIDPLLDRFMPDYDVTERHHVRVAAPAEIALAAAVEADLQESAIVRGLFKARALVLGAEHDDAQRPRALLAQMESLGWGILAEVPGREVVVGAVTQPWRAEVIFRAVPPDDFVAFREPGYVKIAWTLRADPVGRNQSVFRTETRVSATDSTARGRFRWYWARFSPGIILIRRLLLGPLKKEAERRAREATR